MLWLASDSGSSLSIVICVSFLRVGVYEVVLHIVDLDVDARDGADNDVYTRDVIKICDLALCS